MSQETENSFIASVQNRSALSQKVWGHVHGDIRRWPKSDGEITYPQLVMNIWNTKSTQILKGVRDISGTYEEGKALNRAYARLEMISELTSNLLSYASEYAKAYGTKTHDAQSGAEIIAPAFGGKVSPPAGMEMEEHWRYRVENMPQMAIGQARFQVMNKLRTQLVKLFDAVRDNASGIENAAMDGGAKQIDSFGRFREARAQVMREVASIRNLFAEFSEELEASAEIAQERGDTIDPATQRFRLVSAYVQQELLPQLDHELNMVVHHQEALTDKVLMPAYGLITDQREAEIVAFPGAAKAPIEQPEGEALEAAIAALKEQNPSALITEDELALARSLREKSGRQAG